MKQRNHPRQHHAGLDYVRVEAGGIVGRVWLGYSLSSRRVSSLAVA